MFDFLHVLISFVRPVQPGVVSGTQSVPWNTFQTVYDGE